jgi:hypothetical protein
MTDLDRPALRLVDGGAPEDAVLRRRKFEEAHPEAVILPPAAGRWRVVLPAGLIRGDGTRTTLGSWDLAGLMDQLDAIYPRVTVRADRFARRLLRRRRAEGGRASMAGRGRKCPLALRVPWSAGTVSPRPCRARTGADPDIQPREGPCPARPGRRPPVTRGETCRAAAR